MTDIAAMKEQARATWAAGEFDAVVPFIWEAGTAAAEASQCGPGDRVLDIAAGSGNAAIQAAMRGADVVASDLTPELFEPGLSRPDPPLEPGRDRLRSAPRRVPAGRGNPPLLTTHPETVTGEHRRRGQPIALA